MAVLDKSGLQRFYAGLMQKVRELVKDPTANTMTACIGYDQDILGGYDIEEQEV